MVLVVWSGHWIALSSTSPATVPASIAIQLFPKAHIEFVENEYRLAVHAQPPNKSVLGTRESFSVNQALSRTARLDRHRPMCIVMAWVKETVKWTPTTCHRIRLCEQVYRVLVEQVKGDASEQIQWDDANATAAAPRRFFRWRRACSALCLIGSTFLNQHPSTRSP